MEFSSRRRVLVGGKKTGTAFADGYETVSAGDAITVDVTSAESGTLVRVVWTAENGDRLRALASFELP